MTVYAFLLGFGGGLFCGSLIWFWIIPARDNEAHGSPADAVDLDYYRACEAQNVALLEAIGYPHEKDSLTSPEEYAADLKSKADAFDAVGIRASAVGAAVLPAQVPLDPRIAKAIADAGTDLYARSDGAAKESSAPVAPGKLADDVNGSS